MSDCLDASQHLQSDKTILDVVG